MYSLLFTAAPFVRVCVCALDLRIGAMKEKAGFFDLRPRYLTHCLDF